MDALFEVVKWYCIASYVINFLIVFLPANNYSTNPVPPILYILLLISPISLPLVIYFHINS